MKRSTKKLLTAAFVLAAIGAAFLIAGLCMGFTMKDFSAAVEQGKFEITGDSDLNNFVADMTGGTVDFHRSFTDIDSIDLQVGAAECQLLSAEGDKWEVRGYGFPASFECEKQGKKLVIKSKNSGWKFWENRGSGALLELYIPEHQKLDEVNIEAGVGDIYAEGVVLRCKKLDLDCGVGSSRIRADVSRSVDIDGGVGSVLLILTGDQRDFDYDIDCGVGDISIGDLQFSELGGNHRIDNHADKKITADCGVGSIDIQFEEE